MTQISTKGKVLVTGGSGYIGATVCSALIDHGWTPIILDNLSSGPVKFTEGRIFYKGDIADRKLLAKIFAEHKDVYATIHCAALIIVPESVAQPELYYRENVSKSIELFAALRDNNCRRIVFSSSAAIYGVTENFMVQETSPLAPGSPYASSKYMMEMILKDYCQAYGIQGISLRYFNPIGADPKLRTGAYAQNPTHVLGRMLAVDQGKAPVFEITGTDWPTRDGTGIRDYIHVWDLAQAHVNAVKNFDLAFSRPQLHGDTTRNYRVINLGTGTGVTVRELVKAFENVKERPLNKKDSPARPGDVAGSFASADTAKHLIDWEAKLSIEDAIRSALAWSARYAP